MALPRASSPVERHGELIALNFTVTCLSRLMLTLPKMIDAVVQQRGNHPGLRVVYPLDMLRVELAGDQTRILTLRTPDNLLHGQRGEIRPNPRDLRGWR